MKIGIVGAGIAGLACADRLAEQGWQVRLFDKGRGPGGRMSTRRLATGHGDASFDHGAQYLTARDPRFCKAVADWQARGIVAPWPAAGKDALVGVPAMNAVVRDMAEGHDVTFGAAVRAVEHQSNGWHLHFAGSAAGPFDILILAIPAEQAGPFLSLHDFALGRAALRERSLPCWTAMLAFDRPLPIAADALRSAGIIGWAARNNAKPGRSGPESWVLHANPEWSQRHCEDEGDSVLERMLAAFADEFDVELPAPTASAIHRWRFARTPGTGDAILWNGDKLLGACGDWLLGPRVECAWLSGDMLGARIVSSITGDHKVESAA